MLLTTKGAVNATVLGLGLLLTGSTIAQTSDLLISEYVEGSSNNKYVEIFNGTNAPIDLSDYQIRLYSNGNSSPNVVNTLSGFLADGDVVVYGNSSATIYNGNVTNLGSMSFNGDDAIELYNVSTETTSFGSSFEVTVYPSPLVSGDVLNIAIIGVEGEATIEIIGLSGQHLGSMTVQTSSNKESIVEFGTSELSDGVYLCKVLSESGKVSTKRFTVLR